MTTTLKKPDPNFSIVLPGGCNLKCSFCFWDRSSPLNKGNAKCFLSSLRTALSHLPSRFYQISITGGEPTISPLFDKVLRAISKRSGWSKVVLTTNGTNLRGLAPRIQGVVNHVNVSRHHYNDSANQEIMGISSAAAHTRQDLRAAIADLNQAGIDVNLNVVLTPSLKTPADIRKMVAFAKGVCASSVCFRAPHGDLTPSPLEGALATTHTVRSQSGCPVCRSVSMIIDGMPVTWKSSSDQKPGDKSVYELILHPNGLVSPEWDGKRAFQITKKTPTRKVVRQLARSRSGGNCGGPTGGHC